jgi:ubiquinone/menaquinone biosynthesis C-methylase UbiE
VADWYDGLVGDAGSEYHRQVVIPGTVRLLAAGTGDRVLDVACGQGVLCRALSAVGIPATGVDAAVELVRAARDRPAQAPANAAPVEYVVGDARDLSFLPEGAFAAAACVLSVQNIHPLGGLLGGIARCLRPGGRLVLVMMHPAFRVPKASGWGWDAKAGVQFRRVDKYLLPRKVPITTHPGSAPGGYTWTFHKPIGAYVRGLRAAGLLVDAMEEWPSHKTSTSGPRAAAENAAREEVPMFLAIRAVKVAGLAGNPAGVE